MDYIEINKKSYDKIHKEGWGNKYVDTYLVSIYYHVIRHLLTQIDQEQAGPMKCLDFGCSLGANTRFFHDIGFDVYGIDISKVAIDRCVEQNGFWKERFCAINLLHEDTEISALFQDIKFDLVIASNVIYYFTTDDAQKILHKIARVMNEGGVFYANMHSADSFYYKGCQKREDGLYLMEDAGSIDSVTAMSAVSDRAAMEELFNLFLKKRLLYTKVESPDESGYTEDYHYVGIRRRFCE